MLLPPPVVVSLDYTPSTAWTSYVTPKAVWRVDTLPVSVGFPRPAPPGIALDPVALLQVAANPWNLPACSLLEIASRESDTVKGAEAEDGRNDVIVHTTDWEPPLTVGAAGQTIIYVRSGSIVEADIHLNARDYQFAVGDVPGKIDLQSVLTHELGHLVGIGHSEVERATMNATLPSGIAARSLERDDVEAVCALYPGHAEKIDFGCVRWGCPAPWSCVGMVCQRAGEPGVWGAPCATSVRPCEGAGDSAECVATSSGAICGVPCDRDADVPCGKGMQCVDAVDGTYCLPEGVTPVPDAGPVTFDAGADASAPAANGGGESGCSCSTPRRSSGLGGLVSIALLAVWLRRRVSRARG